jgi:hypothetical protein
VNGYTDHLHTRLVNTSTSNYTSIADLHKSQFTAVPIKPFSACCAFTNRSLATASNNGNFSASRVQVLSSQPPLQNSVHCSVLIIISRHGSHRKHRSSTISFVSVAVGTCLPIRCPETAAARATEYTVPLLLRACVLRALHSNDRCLQSLLSNGPIRHSMKQILLLYVIFF